MAGSADVEQEQWHCISTEAAFSCFGSKPTLLQVQGCKRVSKRWVS